MEVKKNHSTANLTIQVNRADIFTGSEFPNASSEEKRILKRSLL
jgi:hypothetical protein